MAREDNNKNEGESGGVVARKERRKDQRQGCLCQDRDRTHSHIDIRGLPTLHEETSLEEPVVIPTGESIPVEGKGDHTLQGGAKVKEILYIPDFKCILLSVSRLRGLYLMKMVQRRKAMAATVETWHKRLGHASKGKLDKIDFVKRETCTIDFNNFCHSCAKAKHIRTPFLSSCIKINAPF
nr:hypothetical protein [Tanacetum cinerariifolium]